MAVELRCPGCRAKLRLPLGRIDLANLYLIDPEEAAAGLERRLRQLQEEIARFDVTIATVGPRIGRIHILESEYARAMRAAEAKWTREVLTDLRSGEFTWSLKAILRAVRGK